MTSKNLYFILMKRCKIFIILLFVLNIIRGICYPLIIFFTQKIIDSIPGAGNLAYQYIACLCIVFMAEITALNFAGYLDILIKNRVDITGGELILRKCSKIEYKYFEDQDTYERLNRVSNRYKEIYVEYIHSWTSMVRLFITLCGITYYLVVVSPWIPIVLAVAVVPALSLSMYAVTKEFNTWGEMYPHFIKARYLTELITKRCNLKETRIFQYYSYIEKAWEEVTMKFNKAQVTSNLKPRYLAGVCVFLQYAVTIVTLFFIYPQIGGGTITAGIFVALAQAMWSFTGDFQYDLIQMFRGLKESKMFTADFLAFLALKEVRKNRAEKISGDSFRSMELQDVWFRYSEKGPYVLKGINLTISRGQIVGLVGENGSGKTTLIKIVLGLLIPEKGIILLNGRPITDENRSELHQTASVVFQDFSRYNLTLQESLSLENPGRFINQEYMLKILNLLQPEGNFMADMKDGFATFLGREIQEGQDLSGGQWQTASVARSILSGKPLSIFDEPTAALDPLAEVAAYNTIYDSKVISTALLATHRLGAVVKADCIYVLGDGIITEWGKHEVLLKEKGHYATLFQKQRFWYIGGQTVGGNNSEY